MTTPTTPVKRDRIDLNVLLEAITEADKGDTRALARVRERFRELPKLVDGLSGLAHNAEMDILSNVPPGARELFREQAANLRQELRAEGTGTALESMLIRRLSLDFLASLQADRARSLAPGQSRPLELSRFYEQQADRAHRRFLASVESLARVRKLITPIQINIADQQLNVTGSVSVGTDRSDTSQRAL